ncbi:MAG: transglycosylase domain-containing protein, partial [Anaerolineaceae bacterium]|nr:transglycosylase domain-containing protein [Anaerolineaceae bacterium]
MEENDHKIQDDQLPAAERNKLSRNEPESLPEQPSERLRRLLAGDEENDNQELTPGMQRKPGEQEATEAADEENPALTDGHPFPFKEPPGNWLLPDAGRLEQTPAWGLSIEPEPSSTAPPAAQTQPAASPGQEESSAGGSELPTIPPPAEETLPSALPSQTEERDSAATRVTPAAYSAPPAGRRPAPQWSENAASAPRIPARPALRQPARKAGKIDAQPANWKKTLGCLLRTFIALAFFGIAFILVFVSFGVFQYFTIARTLPSVADLRERASKFETTRILDRNGGVLYEILDPTAGRRTYVPLDSISPYVVAATLATEDKEFYNHPGFDPVAILRALWQNYTAGETVSGASTITQQLARTLLFSPEERSEKTNQRKAREIVLAAEITRRYSKDEILELYLNEIYYGNLAYGIEAAAETYFNAKAQHLTLSQATFLAGLPQAPSVYDIFTNREETLHRHKQVVILTYRLSEERGCIEVSNSVQPVCVPAGDAAAAASEIEKYEFKRRKEEMRFPHWVNYIRSLLEQRYDSQTIYRSGFSVYTTIDPELQALAQRTVREQVDQLVDHNASSGALVAIKPSSGEILAMVGSADFYSERISGQVNMAVSPRQPGSSIKPVTYAAAFEKGWTPATLIWDVESEFPPSGDPNDLRPPYKPVNYDGRFHGAVLVRDALANSYNLPAVKALQFVGIYDNPATSYPDGFIKMAERLGITTLTRPDYGLSLTLGGGDVTLLDLTSVFSVFANSGRRLPPVAITRIEDYRGSLVYQHEFPTGEQVLRPEHAYLISSILSDNAARTPMFGANSILNLPFSAAAKTGTTNDFRDNWTLGYTPDLAVGVWIGNADYTPMVNTTGLTGAAPIWSQFMQAAVPKVAGGNPSPFARPAGIVEKVICAVSGTEPSEWCPSQKSEMFVYDQPPPAKEHDLWQNIRLDTWTGMRASAYCS